MKAAVSARSNDILAQLPARHLRDLQCGLEFRQYSAGVIFFQDGRRRTGLYFPVSGVIAHTVESSTAENVQFAFCGTEGVVGVSLALEVPALTTSCSLTATCGYWCSAKMFEQYRTTSPLGRLVLRHAACLLAQAAQTAICNRHHSIEQQFCSWLLTYSDRACTFEVNMTQGAISRMLGVRRESITEIAGRLESRGAIERTRGVIRVTNPAAVARCACQCYQALRRRLSTLSGMGSRAVSARGAPSPH